MSIEGMEEHLKRDHPLYYEEHVLDKNDMYKRNYNLADHDWLHTHTSNLVKDLQDEAQKHSHV